MTSNYSSGFRYIIMGICFLCCSAATFSQRNRSRAILVSSQNILSNPPFKQCHASSITELSNGDMMAAWFGGEDEGDKGVCIWISIFTNGKWSAPKQVADGIASDTVRYACWNPVLFTKDDGKVFLYYKVGPSPREWWGLMKYSSDNGVNWSGAESLPDGFLGPIKNKPVKLDDGSLLHPSSTESLDEKTWHIYMEKSDIDGRNWKKIPIDNDTFGLIQPTVLLYPNHHLQLLARSRQNAIVQSWSEDNGDTWGPVSKTILRNPDSGIDGVTTSNGLQVLVYNPTVQGKEWDDGRSILRVAVSRDGKKWRNVYTLERQEKGEFSYPAIIQSRDGLLHITYTYDRVNIKHVALRLPSRRSAHK
ncbi:MAG: sialidase family protein [Flavitalea sp.]